MQKRFTPLKLLEKQTHQRRVLIHLYRMFQQVLLFQRQKQPASPGRSSQKEKTLHRLGWCHSPGRKLPTMQKIPYHLSRKFQRNHDRPRFHL